MKHIRKLSAADRLERLSVRDPIYKHTFFIGCLTKDGYGMIVYEGRARLAHRVSWTLANGEIPDGMHVLHKCDVTQCINPDHLFLGTHTDNMRDMVAKGRAKSLKGIHHPKAKLNPEKAFEIRWHSAMGRSKPDLAKEYNVTRQLIGMIIDCKIWRPERHD